MRQNFKIKNMFKQKDTIPKTPVHEHLLMDMMLYIYKQRHYSTKYKISTARLFYHSSQIYDILTNET